jgi:hypothetical protein
VYIEKVEVRFFFFVTGLETLQILIKSKVYFNGPNNLDDLRQRIRAETEQISPDIIERSVQSVGEC